MKAIHVKDLKDQIGMLGQRPFLKCFECGAEYSANKADYFDRPDNYVFKCCGKNMALVVKDEIYTTVDPNENT